jgi:hypothetical protein
VVEHLLNVDVGLDARPNGFAVDVGVSAFLGDLAVVLLI